MLLVRRLQPNEHHNIAKLLVRC